jgi:hypothetical protein
LEHTSVKSRQTTTIELAKAAMFTSSAVGAGFALAYIPNIELITAIVFAAGAYLGIRWGAIVGAVSMLIFSGANPLGSGFVNPPLIVAQIISMVLVASVGGLLRSWIFSGKWTKLKIAMLGITGGLLTFIYDSLTTLSTPFAFGFENENLLAFYLAGIGFTFLHQLSNMAVFALALPGLFSRIRQPLGTGS